ncbi:alpha/beta hydrolase [Oenococcus alcoholitolerans]|uniref:alpha/beta hydrolase n=1 Tax=Oenococcus alcoholitolerans TaxID=931074 RepID=UPI003F722C58
MFRRWFIRIFIGIIIIYLAVCTFFFSFAEVRNSHNGLDYTRSDVFSRRQLPYLREFQQRYAQAGSNVHTHSDGLRLDAYYLPAARPTDKTVIIVHGYRHNKTGMKSYAGLFSQMGYNTLTVDNRAHGRSQGNFIGYGWLDKDDLKKWIDYLIKRNPRVQIVPFGISMGAATVTMLSGDKLPVNVKAIIEDSGYTSVSDELDYQAGQMFHVSGTFFLPTVSLISKVVAGYSYYQASSVKQLAKNTRPMLFIHGGADKFVPTKMVNSLYKADRNSKKQLYIFPGSAHVHSFADHTRAYRQRISDFLNLYFK